MNRAGALGIADQPRIMVDMIRARKHRLAEAAYFGPKTVSITVCSLERRPFLVDYEVFTALSDLLAECAEEHHSLIPVYCFMPDHIHVLIQGTEEASRPMWAIDAFKLRSGIWLEMYRPEYSLQGEYYDHLVRKSDDWVRQAFYILNNPVRKNLIDDPFEYPFTGALGYDLRTLFDGL